MCQVLVDEDLYPNLLPSPLPPVTFSPFPTSGSSLIEGKREAFTFKMEGWGYFHVKFRRKGVFCKGRIDFSGNVCGYCK